ncbi:MAG TPA: PEP-CTERM sorting domain-containing protein [Bryobacteraceae bacterium]
MKYSALVAAAVFTGLCCANASAAALAGTFNMNGNVTVTANTITWQSVSGPPFTPDVFTLSAGTGSFSTENGTNTINDLMNPPDVVGAPGFPDQTFIVFTVTPGLANLNINFINPGIYTSTNCFSATPAVGQNCTLPGSPFNFVNNPGGTAAPIQATATWVFSGETSDHLSTWTANFTSQFNVPFETVLASFAGTNGTATNSYSAISTVVVTPISSTPEPGTMALMGFGMIVLSAGLRRRVTKKA